MRGIVKVVLLFLLFSFEASFLFGRTIINKKALKNETYSVKGGTDFHLTDEKNPIENSKINLLKSDSWLFLDNIKPSEALKSYKSSILIEGKALRIDENGNARIAIFKQGCVIIPNQSITQPGLTAFTQPSLKGDSEEFIPYHYYTNSPSPDFPEVLTNKLAYDNAFQSFVLKRGYMATFATLANGMGLSRVYIADTADIVINNMPEDLAGKVSYVRVFQWDWPSKKGWCGGDGDIVLSDNVNRQINEINLTNSTWFYSWGVKKPEIIDAEFVPMKWGYGGSMKEIDSLQGVTHLLGYNEPNRPDQSNMSVEQALKEWPKLMESGLRLGSPSVSDNSKLDSWLYRFIDECDKRNYRVDYVTVHAYWGADQMPSPQDWYNTLKQIHQRTGRPIWITEWNNGANWTKEPWPSDKLAQFAKQQRELKNILNVLDTASFVERYSIYNWVEDKRAIIIDSIRYKTVNGKQVKDKLIDQKLTPAGILYSNLHPTFAFNLKNSVNKKWNLNTNPKLKFKILNNGKMDLSWNMGKDLEMIKSFKVKQSFDNNSFRDIATLTRENNHLDTSLILDLAAKNEATHSGFFYQVTAVDYSGDSTMSNVVAYNFLDNDAKRPFLGLLSAPTQWAIFKFKNTYSKPPIIILGTQTNRNKVPQSYNVRNLDAGSFDFKFSPWEYLKNPTFENMDTVASLIIPEGGISDLKGISYQTSSIEKVSDKWKKIKFIKPFKEKPVIFATQISDNSNRTSTVRIRNVTKTDFELKLQYEAAIQPPATFEEVDYLAITPGNGKIGGKKITVGISDENFVGDFFNMGSIKYGETFSQPVFFSAMQTTNDDATSVLRLKDQSNNGAKVFKEGEQSNGAPKMAKEQVGWMVIDKTN